MRENEFVIAFYNLENLFDVKDDPKTLDDDFTPRGFKKWRKKRFYRKLDMLADAISRIGENEKCGYPVLLGIAEVENDEVVEKLLKREALRKINYDYIHYDSPDERGIDTALIYDKKCFEPLSGEILPLLINNTNGERDYTRDILYVCGRLNEELVHVFVNHWPSRRNGARITEGKRIEAARTILRKVDNLSRDQVHNLLIMGDFNDDPKSKSIQVLMDSGLFINPMKNLISPISGSANHKGKWNLFDQVIISHSFLNYEKGTHNFKNAAIFSPDFLREKRGKYKGNPYRTYVGKKYIGGYSDHFPVYVVLKFIP